MPGSFATYPLTAADGTIHQWLAAGVITSPLTHMADHVRETGSPFGERGRWAMNFWAFDPEVADLKLRAYRGIPPRDNSPAGTQRTPSASGYFPADPVLGGAAPGGKTWRYARDEGDGVIDFSRFNFNPTLMEGWLYALIESDAARSVEAVISTIGPARLWLNDELVTQFDESFSYVALQKIPVTLNLREGLNPVVLYGEMLGWREARLALGLSIQPDSLPLSSPLLRRGGGGEVNPGLSVVIPIGDLDAAAWHQAESDLDRFQIQSFAYPDQHKYAWLDPAEPTLTVDAEVRIPVPDTPWAKLIGLELPVGKARLTLEAGKPAPLPITPEILEAFAHLPGENHLDLIVRPTNGIPLERKYEIWASANAYSSTPYGTYDERIQEAREHLAAMPYDVPSSMAAIALGRAEQIASSAVSVACAFLNDRADCADFYAIGLLAALYWHGDTPALKVEDQLKIESAFRGFKFWIDEPGIDAMCYFTENHQVLFHVVGYLTGQRYPDWTFSNSGLTGHEQVAKNAPKIAEWARKRLRGNFSEWDSNAYLSLDAFAMLAIVEFAEDEELRRLAAALLDKIFFGLAAQSYRGTLGSTHGRCYVSGLKSGRVENTSPLCRIAFGMGILNGETRAVGLLALAKRYRVPDVIQQIGADVDSTITTHSRAYGELTLESDMKPGVWDVRTITHRTPHGMISAAVDHHPGSMGIQEHLWQATLSPEAVVFTTYPGNAQEHGNARPNFWAGSVRLPRVGMVGRDLISLYNMEPGIGLGYTHAYFPVYSFDESFIHDSGGWAFARVGDGYIGLWTNGGMILTEHGRHAYQEIRSRNGGSVWICRLGSLEEDGSFEDFGVKLIGTAPRVQRNGIGVTWATPEGKTLSFGWEGAMTVDGVAEDWSNFPHYANTYTNTQHQADSMTLNHAGVSLKLDFT